MYPSIAREEDDNIDDIPDYGEAKRDNHPGKENREGGIEVLSIALEVIEAVVVGVVVAVIADGAGPSYSAYSYSSEDDSEDAEEEFPEVGGVVVADGCS